MQIVWLLIVGAAAGFLATRLMRVEADILTTVLIGMGGALLGGVLMRLAAGLFGVLGGLVGAVVGAMVLIWLWQQIRRR